MATESSYKNKASTAEFLYKSKGVKDEARRQRLYNYCPKEFAAYNTILHITMV